MSNSFDPYHRWLGIPPKHQPADYYRLLGLEQFEDDREVISDAAERQIAHVRRYQIGAHAELSQRILNELAAAKASLLNPARKTAYDQKLREHGTAQERTGPHVASPRPPSLRPLAMRSQAGSEVTGSDEKAPLLPHATLPTHAQSSSSAVASVLITLAIAVPISMVVGSLLTFLLLATLG